MGRLCRWIGANHGDESDEFNSFVDFRSTLRLKCDENGADLPSGVFTFTPTKDTPQRIYFQVCFLKFSFY